MLVLSCLLSLAYFLAASGSLFSAALAAGFGCSVFDFDSLKNDLIFSSTVNFYLLYVSLLQVFDLSIVLVHVAVKLFEIRKWPF